MRHKRSLINNSTKLALLIIYIILLNSFLLKNSVEQGAEGDGDAGTTHP